MLSFTRAFSVGGASPTLQWKDVVAGPAQLVSMGMCARVPHIAARPGSRRQGVLLRIRTE